MSMESPLEGVAGFRFYNRGSDVMPGEQPSASTGIVTAAVGYAQLQGLAARARRFRGLGMNDDDVSKELNLVPGQIQKLLASATRVKNDARRGEDVSRAAQSGFGHNRAANAAAAKSTSRGIDARVRKWLKRLEEAGAVEGIDDPEKTKGAKGNDRGGAGRKLWRVK